MSSRWWPRAILVAPSWMPQAHEAAAEAVLFVYSDRVVQEKLDLWREQKDPA